MPDQLPPKPPEPEKVDPLLASILSKARVIIAEERGLNHKSRMKIQAMGKKMKIPAAVIDQALQLLHGSPPIQGQSESRYEKSFAKIMTKKISEIPGRILTTRIEEKAISVGVRKYQLSEMQARNIIRRVAEEVGVPRVTLTEAERHMEQDIADLIGDETWVTGEKKQRLIRNGKRFGVTAEQTESMIQRHLQFNFQQVQFERKLTDRLWVVAACLVVGIGFALFVFFQMKHANNEEQAIAEEKEKRKEKIKEDDLPKTPTSPDWWDDKLKVLLQKTRLKVNGFAEIHDQIKNPKAVTRAIAYKKIFTLDRGKVNPQIVRQRVAAVIQPLFKSEPDSVAYQGLIDEFANVIKYPAGSVPSSIDFFTKAFWALSILNEMVGDESLGDAKVLAIQQAMEPVAGRKFDLFLSSAARFRKQKRALVEVYFKNLSDVGPSYPKLAPEIFEKLEGLTSAEMPEDKVQDFRNVFLTAFLRFEPEHWNQCVSLIDKAIAESTVSQVSFFIDLMESTENESLQHFLAEALLKRAGFSVESDSIAETANKLRDYFEINRNQQDETSTPQLELIDKLILEFTNRWILRPSQLSNRQAAQLMLETAYLTTLVQLLGSGDSQRLDQLIELGFPDVEDSKYLATVFGNEANEVRTDDATFDDPPPSVADERYARERLRAALNQLNNFKILSPERRINAIRLVHTTAPNITRLTGKDAAILAEYLLSRKSPREKDIVLGTIPDFRHWPRLVVALADQLQTGVYPHQTSLDACSLLLNEDLTYAGQGWPEKLRAHLLSQALEQLRLKDNRASAQTTDPVGNLKSLLSYFYRLRAQAVGVSTKVIPDGDVEKLLDLKIQHYRGVLSQLKKLDAIAAVDEKVQIQKALGNDPLTRIELRQQALLICLEAMVQPSAGEPPTNEAILKLENLIKVKLSSMPTVASQISENEIKLLLFHYRQKLE